jgi:hypothetical protein
VTHKAIPFDESLQYANFYSIAKIENVVASRIAESLKGFATNNDAIVQTAIYNSEIFLEIFNNKPESIAEYLYLRSIQKGYEMGIVYTFSEAFCLTLLANQDKKISKCYKQICRESPEWENLTAEFNLASGMNSARL